MPQSCAKCGILGAGDEGVCLRCVCAALDDCAMPTIQKLALCAHAVAMVDSGRLPIPSDLPILATCGPAIRALTCADDALAAGAVDLCFSIAAQLDNDEHARAAMLTRAAAELEALRTASAARPDAPPPVCSALLVVIVGMLSAELAAGVQAEWLRQLADEIGDPRLSALEGAVRARALHTIASLGYGEAELAQALGGLRLEAHVFAIGRTEEEPEASLDHMLLLSCLVRHSTSIHSGADEATLRALTALLKRWLLGGAADRRVAACGLIEGACESAAMAVLARACVDTDLAAFLLDVLRSDEREVARAALGALHGLALHGLARAARDDDDAAAHKRAAEAASEATGAGALRDGSPCATLDGSARFAAFSAHLAFAFAPLTAALLDEESGGSEGDAHSARAWDLLAIAASLPPAAQPHATTERFEELVHRMIPYRTIADLQRLLAVVASGCRAAWRAGGSFGQLGARALLHLSVAAIERPPQPPNAPRGTPGQHQWHAVVLDRALVGDLCACAAAAIHSGARDAACAAEAGALAALFQASIMRPLLGAQLGAFPAAVLADLALAAEAVLRCGADAAERERRGAAILACVCAADREQAGGLLYGGAAAPASAATAARAGMVNLLLAVAVGACAPGVDGDRALPPPPSCWLFEPAARRDADGEAWAIVLEHGLVPVLSPRAITQLWLAPAPADARAPWRVASLGLAVEIMHAHVFCALAAGAPSAGSGGLAHEPTSGCAPLAPRLAGELRAALVALLAQRAGALELMTEGSRARLLRLWLRSFGSAAALPAECAPALLALLAGFGWARADVECIRFGCAHASRPASVRALRGWLASERAFLEDALQHVARDEAAHGTPALLASAERRADGACTGRDALLRLAGAHDAAFAKIVVGALEAREEEAAAGAEGEEALVPVLDFARLAVHAGGPSGVATLVRVGLVETVGALLERLCTLAARRADGRAAADELGAAARAIELLAACVRHCPETRAAQAQAISSLACALTAWLRAFKGANCRAGVLRVLEAAKILTAAGCVTHAGLSQALVAGIVDVVLPPASGRLDLSLQRAACAALAELARGFPTAVRQTLMAAARERRALRAARPQPLGLVLLVGCADGDAAASAFELLEALCGAAAASGGDGDGGGGAELVATFDALGLPLSTLSFSLLNRLASMDGTPKLLTAAVSLLGALCEASPAFAKCFCSEAWNAYLLRAMVRRSQFSVASATLEGAKASTHYAHLLLVAHAQPAWLRGFVARHKADASALVAQMDGPRNESADHALRTHQSSLIAVLSPMLTA
jgi:hypothetical protein